MPNKRFNVWKKYFEVVQKNRESLAGNDSPTDPSDVQVIAPISQLALEAKRGYVKAVFLDNLQDIKTEEGKMALLMSDQDIGPVLENISLDIVAGASKPARKTTKKPLRALEAAKKSDDEGKPLDALIWLQKVK